MDTIQDLQDLLKHELKDLYSAEVQIINALPKMIETAQNKKLRVALNDHLKVTKKQRDRLSQIQKMLDMEEEEQPKGFFANLFNSGEGEEHCKAMEGLIKEGEKMMGEDMSPAAKDAAIIAAAQKIEHYEISSYGTARVFALQLGMHDVALRLQETLDEEYFADDSLTELAMADVNVKAGGKKVAATKGGGKEPAKKAPAKKVVAKAPAKKAPVKKAATKAPAKKAANKAPAKKAVVKKAATKKSAAKKGGKRK
jgi:ferritin-like metal-binding protein YciE